jgi:hypothetical protein
VPLGPCGTACQSWRASSGATQTRGRGLPSDRWHRGTGPANPVQCRNTMTARWRDSPQQCGSGTRDTGSDTQHCRRPCPAAPPLSHSDPARARAAPGVTRDLQRSILLLSDSVPKATVIRQRAPTAGLNACVANVPSEAMTVIEPRSLLWTLVINPGGKEHARQPSHEHAAHVSCPSESAPGQVKLGWLKLQSTLEVGLRDYVFSYLPVMPH